MPCIRREKVNIVPAVPAGTTLPPPPLDPLHDLQQGYPKLAGRMGIHPETGMFKRFGALNARNLLYMQSELMNLESQLKRVEAEDAATFKSEKRKYTNDFNLLANPPSAGPETRQIHLIKRIREVLKDYNAALIQQQAIYQMKEPSRIDLDDIQNFLAGKHMFSTLCGIDKLTWGSVVAPDRYDKELVVLRPREGTDIFSRWLGSHAMKFLSSLGCAKLKKVNPKYGAIAVMDTNVYKLTFALTSVIASLFPVLSIVVLIILHDIRKRVAVIGVFNVAISLLLTMFTEAKRTDVFAVTAAFAAVQVVFVGSALDDGPKDVKIVAGSAFPNCTCG